MNHYPRHIGDWMRDTAHLTEIEECMYSRCLDQYYSREKALPLDFAQCARLVRAVSAAARKALATVLQEFFVKASDGWHQKRCDEEIVKYLERIELATRASRAGVAARLRNKRPSGQPSGQPDGQPLEQRSDDPTINHKPVTSNQEPVKTKTARGRATHLPPDFGISERVQTWADDKGHTRLAERLEQFVGQARAKGYTYVDWDDAFMNAIRADWAHFSLQNKGQGDEREKRREQTLHELTGGIATKRGPKVIDEGD